MEEKAFLPFPILIDELKIDTPNKEIELVLRKIIEIESLVSISAYITEDAYKADFSNLFFKKNPNANKNEFLGSIKIKHFSEETYGQINYLYKL